MNPELPYEVIPSNRRLVWAGAIGAIVCSIAFFAVLRPSYAQTHSEISLILRDIMFVLVLAITFHAVLTGLKTYKVDREKIQFCLFGITYRTVYYEDIQQMGITRQDAANGASTHRRMVLIILKGCKPFVDGRTHSGFYSMFRPFKTVQLHIHKKYYAAFTKYYGPVDFGAKYVAESKSGYDSGSVGQMRTDPQISPKPHDAAAKIRKTVLFHMLLFWVLLLFALISVVSGACCLSYEGVAVDRSQNLYIGRGDALIVVDPSGAVVRSIKTPIKRGYAFTVTEPLPGMETIIIDIGDAVCYYDLQGNLELGPTPGSDGRVPSNYDEQCKAYAADGTEYVLRSGPLGASVYRVADGQKVPVYRAPIIETAAKCAFYLCFAVLASLTICTNRHRMRAASSVPAEKGLCVDDRNPLDEIIIADRVFPPSFGKAYRILALVLMAIMLILVVGTAIDGEFVGCLVFGLAFLMALYAFFAVSFDEAFCATDLYVANYSKRNKVNKRIEWDQINYVRTTRLVFYGRYRTNGYVLYSKKFSSKLSLPNYDDRHVTEFFTNNNDLLYLPITPEITAALDAKGITFVDDKPLR